MQIGLHDSTDAGFLRLALVLIEDIVERRDALFGQDPSVWDREDCRWGELLAGLPEPVVDPRLSVQSSLLAAVGSLEHLQLIMRKELAVSPIVLGSLVRSALLGAARVVFMLGPEDPEERRANLVEVMRQETRSVFKLYDKAEGFTQLAALVPPAELVSAQRERRAQMPQKGQPMGEERMLEQMVDVIVTKLAVWGITDRPLSMGEHITWIFHTYSGMAHAYGWPRLVPGTGDMPGHFLADCYMVVSLTQLAFQLAQEHTDPTTPSEGPVGTDTPH